MESNMNFLRLINKRVVAATLALAGLGVAPAAHAGVPVIDGAKLIQAIIQGLSWIQQADQMVQQIQQFEAQVQGITTTISKLDSARGLGSILNNPLIRSELPPEMQSATALLDGGGFSGARLAQINGVLSAYSVSPNVNGIAVKGGQASADSFAKMQQVLTSAQARNDQVTDLASQVDMAPDAKASMDLMNRNTIEATRTQIDLTQTIATIEAGRQAEVLRNEADNQQGFVDLKAQAAIDAAALGWQ
jgi:type IV secretion system protein VirB5